MYEDLKTLVVILARGGSKGVPRKNVRPLCGRPVIAYTLDHALESRHADLVVVSSDDPEALRVAEEAGVRALPRPAPLAADEARIEGALSHVLDTLAGEGRTFDLCHVLYACIPVRPPGLVDRAIEVLVASGRDCLVTLADAGKYNPYWMFQEQGGHIRPYLNSTTNRRQELPRFLVPTGSALLFRVAGYDPDRPREHLYSTFGREVEYMVEGAHDTVDIDSERDLAVAGAVLASRREPGSEKADEQQRPQG